MSNNDSAPRSSIYARSVSRYRRNTYSFVGVGLSLLIVLSCGRGGESEMQAPDDDAAATLRRIHEQLGRRRQATSERYSPMEMMRHANEDTQRAMRQSDEDE